MRTAFATLAFAALAAAVPQGVTSAIAPSGSPPAGCSENYDGSFVITPVNTNTKRSLEERQNAPLTITLQGGILKDSVGRTGYVASNSQFQFDNPPQAGAIYTAGFSVCSNGRLAIGNDETWYKCLSGTFFNLYLDNNAGQCTQIYLQTSPVAGSPAPITGSATTAATTGAVTTSTVARNETGTSSMLSNGTGAMNGTMSASSSGMGSSTATTTGKHTGGGVGGTTKTHHTTGAGSATNTQHTTGTAGGATTGASSSSSTGLAILPTARGDVFGLAAGLLAMAVL